MTYETTLTKWGNGRGILIPKEACDAMGASIGDTFELVLDEASRIIQLEPKESYTLHSLMANYTGLKPGEIDAPSSSVGQELW